MRRKKTDPIVRVGSLFERYKKILQAPEKTVIIGFVEVVHDLYGIAIPASSVSYSPHSNILSIRGSGMLKQEILLHHDEIIIHLKGRLGDKSAPYKII